MANTMAAMARTVRALPAMAEGVEAPAAGRR